MSEGLMENGELIVENGGSAWREVRLGTLINHKKGNAFKSSLYRKDGLIVVRVSDTTDNSINLENCKKISPSTALEYQDYMLRKGDIIIMTVGSWPENPKSVVGKVVKVPSIADGTLLNQNAVRIRSNTGVYQNFLYFKLKDRTFSGYLINNAQGSANQASITLDDIFSFEFPLPPLPEQKAIAEVLSALDDKIDLLHRQNKTLEQMAETLFRQWFVVEAGEDWEEYQVSDIANHIKENVKPASNPLLTCRHYSLPAFDNGKNPIIEIGKEILSNKYVVPPQTILVSKLNPRVPRIWAIPDKVAENSICSTEFQVFQPKKELYYGFLCFLFKSDEAVGELEMAASGTSGSHQRVKPQDILNIIFMVPSLDKIEEYSQEVKPLIKKQQRNNDYIRTLQSLRDTLLPKLMSGQIRVQYDKEAE